jgi:hypothetical protein
MNENPVTPQKKRRVSRLFWIGLALFLLGSGPLLLIILLARLGFTHDPNPNPVAFGILAGLTFWPSLILMVVGIARTVSKKKREP